MGNTFFYLVILCVYLENFRSFGEDICKSEPRCGLGRTRSMRSADCFKKEFRDFPKCVPNDIEILELSVNRIRKVSRFDLSKFTNLKLLYLKDNLLSTLQNDTFQDLDDLQILDISQNNIKIIPSSVFKLPSLKKLYLSQNPELNMAASIANVKPILSPISMIDLSFTTDEYSVPEFPDFGAMPYLVFLNISENQYQVLMPKHFAGLCNLQTLIKINIANRFADDCDCWIINKWLTQRNVQFQTFVCPVVENDCLDRKLKEEDKATYHECLELINTIKKGQLMVKISIGTGISLLIIVVLLCFVYYFFIRRRRSNNKGKKNSSSDIQTDGPLLKQNHLKGAAANM